jgi:hypothetical protein
VIKRRLFEDYEDLRLYPLSYVAELLLSGQKGKKGGKLNLVVY